MIEHSYRPTDAAALASLHAEAFPGFFLSHLGPAFLKQFYLGFIGDSSAVVAVEFGANRVPIAVAVGTTEPSGFFRRLLQRRLIGFVSASALAALKDPRVIGRLLAATTYRGGDQQAQGALLSSICVSPRTRSHGVGARILDAWVRRAGELGSDHAFLTTDARDNDRVNAFYERNGWVLRGEIRTTEGRVMNQWERTIERSAVPVDPPLPSSSPLLAMALRSRDIFVSATGLVATAPLLMVAAFAIKAESSGPVVFRQRRMGKYGEEFSIHKLRTMKDGARGLTVSSSRDPRTTKVGRFLRRTKIDELPQLWDVLRGKMSLVGPRPEIAEYVHEWPAKYREQILSVRPGITDPASIAFRHEDELLAASPDPRATYVESILPEKAAMYAQYVREQSFGSDMGILWATACALFQPAPISVDMDTTR